MCDMRSLVAIEDMISDCILYPFLLTFERRKHDVTESVSYVTGTKDLVLHLEGLKSDELWQDFYIHKVLQFLNIHLSHKFMILILNKCSDREKKYSTEIT